LDAYALKVSNVHGNNYPNLKKLYLLVQELQTELIGHMQKEEQVLFPYLKSLSEHDSPPRQQTRAIKYPISVLMEEHDHAGTIMSDIRILTDDYTTPQGACNTFQALYHLLEEFESDLHIHVHLENNILFQRVTTLSNTESNSVSHN
jgi:regulator of cell morphogenesis and NO signaling